ADDGLPEEVTSLLKTKAARQLTEVTLPNTPKAHIFRPQVENAPNVLTSQFTGPFSRALISLMRQVDLLIGAWSILLERTRPRIIVSTEVSSPWSSALFVAGQTLGIPTAYVQQGFINWPCPACSLAIL